MLISEKLVSKLLDIERAANIIENSGISSKRYNKYILESTIDSVFYLGRIIYPKITKSEAKRISKAKDVADYQILTNYRKVLEYIRYQSEFSTLTPMIANHINKLLCDQIIEGWQPRNPLSRQKYDIKFDYTKVKPQESDTIENIVSLTQKTDLSILKASEIFQYTINLKPFIALNDITAIALCTYECTRFYRKIAYLLSFPYIFLSQDNLDDIIESNNSLDILISGIHTEITDLKDRIIKHSYQDKVDKNSEYADLSERQLAVLRYLQNNPRINRRQYMKLFKVSTMTAFRDLNDLVNKKIIRVNGVGRGTYYELERI